jgi:bla regulator protein BlaR1
MMTTTSLVLWLADTTMKGSIMILLVAAIHWMIGARVDGRWRHLLWVVVLLRLVMPQVPASSLSLFNLLPERKPVVLIARADVPAPSPVPFEVEIVDRGVLTFAPSPVLKAARWAFWIWLAGAAFFALRMLIASIRAHRAVRAGERLTAGPLPIVECDLVRAPALHGVFRPVLLLPRGFTNMFTADELRHVILHETWHLKRMDVAVSWLLAAAQTIHWFNPLVWFAASRIREERELSCDELALSLLEEEERTGYGRTILKLLDRFRPVARIPALVGIVNQKQKMKRRLTMIASFRNGTRFTTMFLALVAAVGVAGLTDAQGGTHRIMKKLDPAKHASAERLHQRVSFELNNASFGDLLNAVSNKIGAPVTQSPDIATSAIQNARFTLKADNVPAHAVLMEALLPFELSAEPTDAGITITDEPAGHAVFVRSPRHEEEDVVVTKAKEGETRKRVVKVMEMEHDGEAAGEKVERRVFVNKVRGEGPASFDEAGKLRREMTINIEENGVKSEGKLTLEITK